MTISSEISKVTSSPLPLAYMSLIPLLSTAYCLAKVYLFITRDSTDVQYCNN
jgi:hypothetical protein